MTYLDMMVLALLLIAFVSFIVGAYGLTVEISEELKLQRRMKNGK